MRKEIFKNPKKLKLLLLSIIIIYFVSFSLGFFIVSNSFYNSITRIYIPDDYMLMSLDPNNPRFEASYTIYNKNGFDFTTLEMNMTMKVEYVENVTFSTVKAEVFNKLLTIHVPAFTVVSDIFLGGNESFNLLQLQEYWDTVANVTETKMIMDLDISGRYCLGTIPFYIKIRNFEVGKSNGCENCGGCSV